MQIFPQIGYLLIAYFIGAIPFGWIFVMMRTGQDIRDIQSGRTGGTNTMRAVGFWLGFLTAIMDVLKSASTVWIAKSLYPEADLLHVLAPIAAILGHNYSIFMIKRYEDGRIKLGGGAGGAATLGGSFGLWWPTGAIIFVVVAAVFFFVGYASVTTLSIALLSTIIFAIRASLGLSPWIYAVYGLITLILLIWALRPNIRRLYRGEERLHGFRKWLREKRESKNRPAPQEGS